MCVVSMVMDHGRDMWPGLIPGQPWITPIVQPDHQPNLDELIKQIEIGKHADKKPKPAKEEPGRLPTKEEMEAFLKLVKLAEEYDRRTNQPHCEDPEKIKLLEAIEKRLAEIEKRLDIKPDDHFLVGSNLFGAHVPIGDQQVQLGEIVRRAFENWSRDNPALTAAAWNALDQDHRDDLIMQAIRLMRRAGADAQASE